MNVTSALAAPLWLPYRRTEPDAIVAHLGPTNSGKTHDAIGALLEAGAGCYAAPLRMLAWEGYDRLRALLGDDQVGLVTGEEQINPTAAVLCTTVELAPRSGQVLVLDEVHWAADSERGSAWTRLLLAGEYRRIELVGAADALPMLQAAFADRLEVRLHERLGQLEWVGATSERRLRPSTALVAFSRRTVLWLAGRMAARYGADRVAVLYGSMPPAARREQVRRVRDGDADLVVCTDVIGHGLNLPIRTVLFAETSKFDGRRRRPLEPWEAAQVAGRAGRFGLHERGEVGILVDVDGLEPDGKVARRALRPAAQVAGGTPAHRIVQHARVRPTLGDLGRPPAHEVAWRLRDWVAEHRVALRGHPWLAVESPDAMLDRIALSFSPLTVSERAKLDAADLWRLARSPLDPSAPESPMTLERMARAVCGQPAGLELLLAGDGEPLKLRAAEALAARAAALRWFTLAFPQAPGPSAAQAAQAEEHAAGQVREQLDVLLAAGQPGCEHCGKPTAPWAQLCRRCARASAG